MKLMARTAGVPAVGHIPSLEGAASIACKKTALQCKNGMPACMRAVGRSAASPSDGFLAFWLSGFLAFWLSGFLAFWLSGFLAPPTSAGRARASAVPRRERLERRPPPLVGHRFDQ
nr:hypothetical protein [Burkholderia ambifaria]